MKTVLAQFYTVRIRNSLTSSILPDKISALVGDFVLFGGESMFN